MVCGSTEFLRARGMFWLDGTDAVDRGEGNDLLLLRRWSEFVQGGGWCFYWWREGGGLVVRSKIWWLLSNVSLLLSLM